MCTMIVEKIKVDGSGKGSAGWFTLQGANISFDHPFNAPLEHALNIDFVNESMGPGARVAVERKETWLWSQPWLSTPMRPEASAARYQSSFHQRQPIMQVPSSSARASGETIVKLVAWSCGWACVP